MKIVNLTPNQCIRVAKLLYPEVNWNYHISVNKWGGHDLVGDVVNSDFSEYSDYFQISFSGEYFYFDAGLNEYEILGEEKLKINKFIEEL